MNKLILLFFVACLSIVVYAYQGARSVASDKMQNEPQLVSFSDLKWIELSGRKGMEYAVISGDSMAGAYTHMRKVPAGTNNGVHAHSSELKNVIISGVWYTGADLVSARDFGPGSVVVMPANWVHVSGCRSNADCLFYQEGKGRFDFKPVSAK